MPHMKLYNMQPSTVFELSKEISSKLSEVVGCPADWFTFSYVESSTYVEGSQVEDLAFVEVKWFARPIEIQDAIAKIITDALLAKGVKRVTIDFYVLEQKDYYENGARG